MSHGFMSNESMCMNYAKLLAEIGYACFTFDFNGGGPISRSEGKTEDMTVLTEKADLLSVFSYVSDLPFIDSSNISLLGCSQGGFVSAITAVQLQDKIKKLIMLYPALCIPDDARKGQLMVYKFDPNNIPDLLGTKPMKLGGNFARAVINMDAFSEISGFNGDTLLIHGTKDSIVDISYSRRAKDFYPNIRYQEIDGAGHVFFGEHDQQAKDIIKSFMQQN